MNTKKGSILALSLVACISLTSQALAGEDDAKESLSMQTVEVSELNLTAIEEDAKKKAYQIHQESTVGRSGLSGVCANPPGHPKNPND